MDGCGQHHWYENEIKMFVVGWSVEELSETHPICLF